MLCSWWARRHLPVLVMHRVVAPRQRRVWLSQFCESLQEPSGGLRLTRT